MIQLTFNAYSLLISIAFFIAVTFGFLLFFSKNVNKKADRYLAALLFIVALWNASVLILDIGVYQYFTGIIWVPLSFTLALGPCFYFYVRFMTNVELLQPSKVWLHFIPVVLQVCLYLLEVFQGLPLGVGYFDTPSYILFEPIVTALAILSLIIYSTIARINIKKYHQWVENNYSHTFGYNLNWLLRLSSLFLIVLTIWMGYFCIDYFLFEYRLSVFEYYPFHLTLAILSIWMSIEAYSKPEIIYPDKVKETKAGNDLSTEDDCKLEEQALWLKQKIEQNLLYLDPEISLKTLAVTIDLHPNLVSKIINEGLKQTFSDCINEYRVKEVIKKLRNKESENTTFLAIAFDCGFNSKTTFNRVFKKQTGLTPLQYQKKPDLIL